MPLGFGIGNRKDQALFEIGDFGRRRLEVGNGSWLAFALLLWGFEISDRSREALLKLGDLGRLCLPPLFVGFGICDREGQRPLTVGHAGMALLLLGLEVSSCLWEALLKIGPPSRRLFVLMLEGFGVGGGERPASLKAGNLRS